MINWIYLDYFKNEKVNGYRISLPDGKRLDYYLDEGEIDDKGTIGFFGIRNDTQAPVVMGRNKGNAMMRLNKILRNDLVYLAGEYRTGVYDRTLDRLHKKKNSRKKSDFYVTKSKRSSLAVDISTSIGVPMDVPGMR